jgi:hypothetical protein
VTGEPSEGSAALSVSFTYPPSAFLYAHTAPRLRVDGRDIPVETWGTHQVAVEAGRHGIEVWGFPTSFHAKWDGRSLTSRWGRRHYG